MKTQVKVLVVDDLDKKRGEVKSRLLQHSHSVEIVFDEADDYESARDALRQNNYDFVVLDLMIPAGGEQPSEKWSRFLLSEIMEGSLCFPMHVFGLTEHQDVVQKEREHYDKNLFGLFVFLWDEDGWAQAIASKIEYLTSAVASGASYRLNGFDYDLLIVTARYRNEFVPVKKVLFGSKSGEKHPLWNDKGSHFGRIALGQRKALRAGLLCIGATGLAPAAASTTQAIQILRPRMIVMVGMCAGFESKGLRLLDILVAREAGCWQEGKTYDDAEGELFDPRGKILSCSEGFGEKFDRSLEIDGDLYEAAIGKVAQSAEFMRLVDKYGAAISRAPRVKPGLVVSGSAIVASEETRKEINQRFPSALGLEMEIFAVYMATKMAKGARGELLAIKGVADFADGKKGDEAQPLASELSAIVLKTFLQLSTGLPR